MRIDCIDIYQFIEQSTEIVNVTFMKRDIHTIVFLLMIPYGYMYVCRLIIVRNTDAFVTNKQSSRKMKHCPFILDDVSGFLIYF